MGRRLTSGHLRRSRLHALALVTATFAALLAFLPVGNTGDTPCGALIDRNFEWASFNQCGITYSGTTAVIVLLVIFVAAALVVVEWKAPGHRAAARLALVLAAAVGAGAYAAFTWTASAYPEPVVRRGWTSVRNVTGIATLYLAFLAAFYAAPSGPSS